MAKKGIEYVVFGKLQANGTYKDGKRLSPAAAFNGSATKSNVKDYGDNRAVETDNSVTGGTLTVELNDDTDEIYTYLLGNTQATDGEEIVSNADDIAPYVGVGAIGMSGTKFVAKFYNKVQFSEPNDDNQTKQENTTFNHISLEGEILIPEDGNWRRRKTFATREEAKTYLNKIVGITETEPHSLEDGEKVVTE